VSAGGYEPPMDETPKDLVHEAEAGRSARTPAIALTGVTLVVGAFVGVLIAIVLVVYFVTK
jgi:hypothetical protein